MPDAISQQKRTAEFVTPLGADVLGFTRLEAHEAMSEPFSYVVSAIAERSQNIEMDRLIGRNCAVRISVGADGATDRWYHGVLMHGEDVGHEGRYKAFRFVLRPWFSLLDHMQDCRFFLDKTVVDVVQQVFTDAGFSDFEFKTTISYPKMEFCVQYRETHLNFVSRLLEEFGIYYYFEHSRDKHKMVLADDKGAYGSLAGGSERRLVATDGASAHENEVLLDWVSERKFRSGRIVLDDYNFETPLTSLDSDAVAGEDYERSKLEVFDYPGRFLVRPDGDQLARMRLQAEQAGDRRRYANGRVPTLFPGAEMSLTTHADSAENLTYLVVGADHVVDTAQYASSSGGGVDISGSYVFQPKERPYRPPARARKPLINGIQTAKVVGDGGEEVTVDQYGRIKVQFHWDRKKMQSCWIRVAEMWSGKGWGSHFHPRHGQEVVVEFLEGDPDRPLVVGTVYNADQTVPYELPASKTKSGWKSNSSKGGGGFNELRLEDLKGSEEVYLRAEKDLNSLVQNAETRKVGTVFPTAVGQSSRVTTLVNGDDEHVVEQGNHKVTVGHDQTVHIKNDQKIDVDNTITITARNKITIQIENSMTKIEMDSTSIKLTALNIQVEATTALQEKGGVVEYKADTAMTIQGTPVKIN